MSVGLQKQERLASNDVFEEHRQWLILLLAVVRARLPSLLDLQGSAESSKRSSGVAGGVATAFSVTWRRNVRAQRRRRRRSGTISKSQSCWRQHRVALSLPRQLETTPVSEVLVLRRQLHLCGCATHAPRPWKKRALSPSGPRLCVLKKSFEQRRHTHLPEAYRHERTQRWSAPRWAWEGNTIHLEKLARVFLQARSHSYAQSNNAAQVKAIEPTTRKRREMEIKDRNVLFRAEIAAEKDIDINHAIEET